MEDSIGCVYSLETGEMMRKEGKGSGSECIRKCKNVSGLTSFKYAENARVFDVFMRLEG